VVVVVGIKEIGEAITITIRVDMVVQWTATTETMIQAMETTEVVAITAAATIKVESKEVVDANKDINHTKSIKKPHK
jgi:hypothetical protein